MSNISKFYKRKLTWVIFFYNPRLNGLRKYAEQFKLLAENMKGLIEVGVLDLVENEEIWEELGVNENAYAVKIFSDDYKDQGDRYYGEIEWRALSNAATTRMQSNALELNSKNFDQFIENNKESLKVILFVNRLVIPPMYKVLSRSTKLASFGVVSSNDEVSKKFSINSLPSIWVITNFYDFSTDWFRGEMNLDSLKLFLDDYIKGRKKADNSSQRSLIELTKDKLKQGLCSQNDQNLCLIYFSEGAAQDRKVIDNIERSIGKFKNDPIVFTFVNIKKSPEFYRN